MNDEIREKYIKAGHIAAQAREHARKLAKEGALLLDIAEAAEKKVVSLGGGLAFPVNLSLNDAAAHYSPPKGDRTVLHATDYLKIDVGAHVDGYIGDTAITVRLAGEDDLMMCAESMLETGVQMMRPGTTIIEVGQAIENVAREFGFNAVRNLTGHGLARYNLHAGVLVPNIRNAIHKVLEDGEVYAIEPFCTAGNGMVKDCDPALIFRWIQDKPTRMPEARKVLDLGRSDFNKLPFAKRWLPGGLKMELALKQLTQNESIYPYKILKEVSGKPVAQAEHTVIVGRKPFITTRL